MRPSLIYIYYLTYQSTAYFIRTCYKLPEFSSGSKFQKQPPRGVPRKRCSENMHQIYRRIPLLKCDFNKVAKLLFFVTRRTWFTPSLLFSNSQGYSYSFFIKLQQLNFSQIYSVLLNITVFDQRYLFYKISLTFVFTQLLQLWNIINLFT